MFGHIYKDFKASFWHLMCILMLAVFVIIMTVYYSADIEELKESIFMIAWGLVVINLLLPMLAMFAAYDADEKEKWISYAMALPEGIKGYVKSKYMFIVIIIVIGALFTHFYASILDGICNEFLLSQIDYFIIMTASGMGMLMCAFFFPFVFRFGGQMGNMLAGNIIILVLLAYYCYMMFGDLSLFQQENFDKTILHWLQQHYESIVIAIYMLFFVGMFAMAVSYQISIRIFRKGAAVRE